MKKFLSLVLALAMTLSLVTVTAGAKDFADSDELSGEQYEEAVNVMSEMGIIDGYASGDFQPQGTLTRGAAAKIIACMMLGKTTAEALGTQAAPFKDVPAGSTFAGYIAYCVESGLIDGYADGTFRPQNTLTGFAFLKMLLTALGYDSSIEGYTGTNWTVNVAGRATQIGLTAGNDDFVGTKAATREEACLYAVNTLKATLVEYENKGQEITVSDGTVINIRPSAPTFVTSNIAGAATSIDDTYDNTRQDYTVEFAEKYQPDLELDGDIDVFGRPSHTWSWKGNEIGSYVDYDKMIAEYTAKVTGRDLYDVIGRNILTDKEYDFYISVDGETEKAILDDAYFTVGNLVRTNTDGIGETGNGVLTQVFVDTKAKETYIAVINTYLAIATDDYDERKEEASFDVYDIVDAGRKEYVKADKTPDVDIVAFDVLNEDINVEDIVDDQIVLVTVADGAIQTIEDPEVLSEVTIDAFKLDSWLETDGTPYDYASTAMWDTDTLWTYTGTGDTNLKDATYNVYLDPYGYAIGLEEIDPADNYLFLTGIDLNDSYLGVRTANATAIFLDGRMDPIEVNVRDSDDKLTDGTIQNAREQYNTVHNYGFVNAWFTYTVDSNGVYTLDYAERQSAENVGAGSIEINRTHINRLKADGRTYAVGNDETVYINTSLEDNVKLPSDTNDRGNIIDDVDSVTVGARNVDLVVGELGDSTTAGYFVAANEIYTLYDKDNWIIGVITVEADDQGASSNYAYVTSDDVKSERYDSATDTWTWVREVVINGELTDITYVDDSSIGIIEPGNTGVGRTDNQMDQGYWYEVTYYANGNVKSVEALYDYFDHDVTTGGAADNTDEFIAHTEEIEGTYDRNTGADPDVAVLWMSAALNSASKNNYPTANHITFNEQGSVYTYDTDRTGFSVSPDVKVIVANAGGRSQSAFDTVTDGYTGYAGLRRAIRDLNNNDPFEGDVSAILENGIATSIIFNCTAPDDGFDEGEETSPTGDYDLDYFAVVADGATKSLAMYITPADAGVTSVTARVYMSTSNSEDSFAPLGVVSQFAADGGAYVETSAGGSHIQLPDGVYFFYAVITDGNGNTTTTDVQSVIVRN